MQLAIGGQLVVSAVRCSLQLLSDSSSFSGERVLFNLVRANELVLLCECSVAAFPGVAESVEGVDPVSARSARLACW